MAGTVGDVLGAGDVLDEVYVVRVVVVLVHALTGGSLALKLSPLWGASGVQTRGSLAAVQLPFLDLEVGTGPLQTSMAPQFSEELQDGSLASCSAGSMRGSATPRWGPLSNTDTAASVPRPRPHHLDRAGAWLFNAESNSVLTEAGVHHRVESVSRERTAGVDAQAGQCCLWEGAQHRLEDGEC